MQLAIKAAKEDDDVAAKRYINESQVEIEAVVSYISYANYMWTVLNCFSPKGWG